MKKFFIEIKEKFVNGDSVEKLNIISSCFTIFGVSFIYVFTTIFANKLKISIEFYSIVIIVLLLIILVFFIFKEIIERIQIKFSNSFNIKIIFTILKLMILLFVY
mgnify:CR=1 FL=1